MPQPVRAVLALLITLGTIYAVPNRVAVAILLPVVWWIIFRPLTKQEAVMFLFASVFFLGQNYVTLKDGLFEFHHKDILLMPWYEPGLWGFYFLGLKRFVSDPSGAPLTTKGLGAVLITSLMFSLFSHDSRTLFLATSASTAALFVMFHSGADVAYALSALGLGLIIELFGVSTGLWWYPAPDFLGIPYWFGTMWLSVGLLGRRFLMPVSGWLAAKFWPQGA